MALVKSADRVIQIFEGIGFKDNGITQGELSNPFGIPKGSLSLILSNLVDRDYLTVDQLSKRYTLGLKLIGLTGRYFGSLDLGSLDIVREDRPVLDELVKEIN